MEKLTNFDKYLYAFVIAFAIFIIGIQIGIAHGKELQKQSYYEYTISD